MSISTPPAGDRPQWPTDKLTALRLGQRLVAEVPAAEPGRRAFVTLTPVTTPADIQAGHQGWKRADHTRVFLVQHHDYDADLLDGFDYDQGALMIRDTTATGESELTATLQAWNLHPDQLRYPWQTSDPR